MKLFIFDIGGVVCANTSVSPEIAKYLGISLDEFIGLAKLSGLDQLQTGRISTEEFWQDFSKFSGKSVREDLWAKFFNPSPIDGTIQLVERLRKHFKVVAGTNTIASHYEIHLKSGHYDIFDAVYASHLIHFAKPDAEFFKYILKCENVAAEQTFFTDDDPRNIEVALKLNINAVLFTSPEDLTFQVEASAW